MLKVTGGEELTFMYKTKIAAYLLLTGMACMGIMQGETVESRVGVNDLVPIPGNTPTELTHIHLHHGNWLISGLINSYESAESGTVFLTGNIDLFVGLSSDLATCPVTSQQLDHKTNVIMNVAFPSRLVEIPPSGADVYLTMFSNQPGQPPPNAFAWGYISADCIGD